MQMTRNLTLEDFYLLNQLHSVVPETAADPDEDLDEEEDDEEEDEDGEDEQDDVDDTDAIVP